MRNALNLIPQSSPQQILTLHQVLIAAELIYQLSMSCIKISILLFYYRLFRVNPRFVIAVWVMATVTACWYFTSTFVIIFQCFPVHYMWDRKIPGGQCIPQEALWIGSSVTSLLTDVAILCLPMPMIWNLRIPKKQKVALAGVFLLGTLYVSEISFEITKLTSYLKRLRNINHPSHHHR